MADGDGASKLLLMVVSLSHSLQLLLLQYNSLDNGGHTIIEVIAPPNQYQDGWRRFLRVGEQGEFWSRASVIVIGRHTTQVNLWRRMDDGDESC